MKKQGWQPVPLPDYDDIAGQLPSPHCSVCKKSVERMLIARRGEDTWRALFWCHGQSSEVSFGRRELNLFVVNPAPFFHAVAF